jgi:hypothetical protein
MYSLTDMRGLMRMLIDRTTARRMFYSWYGFLSDPAPRLMSRLSK